MSSRIVRRSKHALERAEQRLGVRYTKQDLIAMSEKIKRGEGVRWETKGDRETWVITYSGKAMKCVYNPTAECFITIMERPGKYSKRHRRT